MSDIEPILVEVVYALPEKQKLVQLLVDPGTTAFQAAEKANLTAEFPDLDIESSAMGLFGQSFGTKGLAAAKSYQMKAGDRVEIYRPLTADPKEVRRRRAEKAKAQAAQNDDKKSVDD